MSIDQQPVTGPDDAAKKLQTAANKGQALLLINRGGTPEFVALSTGNGQQGSASGSSTPR